MFQFQYVDLVFLAKKLPYPVFSRPRRAVVRQWIAPRQAWQAAAVCLAIGCLIGFYIVARVGWPILAIGAVGVFIGVLYTWGPWPLKYHAFGDLAVFLDFGIVDSITDKHREYPANYVIPLSRPGEASPKLPTVTDEDEKSET